jgi:phosphate transport system protein
MDDEVDDLYDQIQRELVTYMLEDPRNISKALMLMRVGRSLERIGDHMENIAERVRYWVTGERGELVH